MDARHATQTPPHLAAPADAARWPGSVAAARELQRELAARIVLKDGFPAQLRTVAGVDVGFEEQGRITRAAVVLLDAASLQPLQQHVVRVDTLLPYIPGMLSFREMPALLPALARLSTPPDLVLVDGQGIAHPRRLGVAAHLGLATSLPTIGVAKSVLTGTSGTLHEMRGAFAPLRDGDEQIGWMLRSKSGCLPLVVSPGHRVSMAAAPELVMRFTTRYRLPEPTRLADRIASRRGEVLVQPAIAEA